MIYKGLKISVKLSLNIHNQKFLGTTFLGADTFSTSEYFIGLLLLLLLILLFISYLCSIGCQILVLESFVILIQISSYLALKLAVVNGALLTEGHNYGTT